MKGWKVILASVDCVACVVEVDMVFVWGVRLIVEMYVVGELEYVLGCVVCRDMDLE